MSQVLEANIFFLITGIAVIVVGVGMSIALFYIIRILRDISEMASKLNRASREIEADFETLRHEIKNEGVKVRAIADIALGFLMSRMKKRTAPRRPKIIVTEEDALQ